METNWVEMAFGVATRAQTKILWSRLTNTKEFWPGNMPTLSATRPDKYEDWQNDAVPFNVPATTHDVASKGRTWYLEVLACKRMHKRHRLLLSAQLVAKMTKDGYLRERYNPTKDRGAEPSGNENYCEYAAVDTRIWQGNKAVL